jgi:O-antigen ligase
VVPLVLGLPQVSILRFGWARPLGSLLALGFLTACAGLWAVGPFVARRARTFAWSYGCFLFWAWGGLLRAEVTELGLQNLVVFTAFYLGVLFFSLSPESLMRIADWTVLPVLVTASVLFLLAQSRFPEQPNAVFLARPFALWSVALVVWVAARRPFLRRAALRLLFLCTAVLALAVIAVSTSRAALAIGLAVLVFSLCIDSTLRFRRLRFLVAVLLVAVGLFVLVVNVERFRERPGEEVVEIRGVEVNVSGRSFMWLTTVDSWLESVPSIVLGKGPGSVGPVMESFRPGPHPHNEYLRLLHDYGVVGFALWLGGIASLFFRGLSGLVAEDLDRESKQGATILVTSILVLLGASLVLNPLVYVFFMAPLAVFVGLGLASGRRVT